ncbi:hypothetical protein [Defluviitalea saccharophila]|uniref:Choloylglycine hydrolase/NAAA C-terminal domain-containing protein n=1 Tax=Defluviitalea saccharophila TaxID=879970 RepID=A0ABZ2YA45_9FIRM|nr:hypothetical protein [Candidatus Epulonipiscium sp.]
MRKILWIMALVILVSIGNQTYACSGYAVYKENVYYGMNWDYPPGYDATLSIVNKEDMRIFLVYDSDGNFFTGMNDQGLFAMTIMVTPEEDFGLLHENSYNNVEHIVAKDLFFESLFNYSNMNQVNNYLKDKRLFYSTIKLHNMLADTNGNAQIVEVGKDKNRITAIKDNFLLISNFPQYYFENTPYNQIVANGSDRYIAGYDYILKNIEHFDRNHGLKMLEAMKCVGPTYYTLCSFLFEPKENTVYIALNRDYERIWKISIAEGTAETYKGFESPMKIKFGERITLSQLKKLTDYNASILKKFDDQFIIRPDLSMPNASESLKKQTILKYFKTIGLLTGFSILGIIYNRRKLRRTNKVKLQ